MVRVILTFRPIKVWPESFRRDASGREGSPFKASYRSTLLLLDRELSALRAKDPTLQLDADPAQIRIDGQLRADAKVDHPGVILSFDTRKHGTLTYSCDKYARNWGATDAAWKHNLRAVALGLEALRKVERYGIAERGQQYAGYRELGAGVPMGPAPMSADAAAEVLRDAAAWVGPWDPFADPEQVVVAFRLAAKRHHPDVGGDSDLFRRITEAKDLLSGPGLGP